MEIILGALGLIIGLLAWLLHGAMNNRIKDKDAELDQWEGVTDVRRKARDKLADDPDYARRVQDEFNDK